MTTLALAMIVRDEAATLGALLASVAPACDELVVVDTGSVDGTVDIARTAGARVVEVEWRDDFAWARNASFDACTADWVLWLDADDRLPAGAVDVLKRWKAELLTPGIDAVALPYRYHWSADGTTCLHSFSRERLVRRASGARWSGRVHEVVDVGLDRTVVLDDTWVEHRPLPESRVGKPQRNLRILEAAYAEGDRSLRTLFYLANELRDALRYDEARDRYADYLAAGSGGWEHYSALVSAGRCARALGDVASALAYFHRAVRHDPTRAEALLEVGRQHYLAEEWALAVPFLTAATTLVMPKDGFVEPVAYGYEPWDLLSICLHRTGRHREALLALLEAVDGNPERDRLIDNAGWFLRAW